MEDTTLKEAVEDPSPIDTSTAPQDTSGLEPRKTSATKKPSALKRACAILSIFLAVGAWLVFFFAPTAAAVIAAISAVTAIVGITVGHGCLRDIAITALIASAILLIVLAAFYWGVPAAIDSL